MDLRVQLIQDYKDGYSIGPCVINHQHRAAHEVSGSSRMLTTPISEQGTVAVFYPHRIHGLYP
jgi:hypothetical protein